MKPAPEAHISSITHLFFLLLIVMCLAFGCWAYYAKLDIVSMATGEVVPSGKVKHVQHFEGGIINKILVKEGDVVTADQALVELEQLRSGASLEEIQMRVDALKVDVLRFEALVRDKDKIDIPPDITQNLPLLVKEARHLFRIHKKTLQSTINKLNTIVKQREQRIKAVESRLENKRQRLPLLEEQLSLSEELLADNLTTRYKHLEIMRQTKEIEGGIQNDIALLKEARHALNETREKRNETIFSFKEETTNDLKTVKQELKEFSVRLTKFEDSLKRTIIRSPINGIVKKLYIVTQGGVLRPGDTIVDIVPSEEKLVIEAHLNISDIGYIKKYQPVLLQLPGKDAGKFDKLKGKVFNISPDTFKDAKGQTFYSVRIESEKSYFQTGEQRYQLYPGMVLVAHIHIGQRTVLEYLLDPYINTLGFSLQER